MVPARAVAEAPGVTCNGARPLRQFHGKAEAGAHRLAWRSEPGQRETPGHGVGSRSDPGRIRLLIPLIGESGVGTDPATEAPGEPVTAASDERLALEAGEVHRGR